MKPLRSAGLPRASWVLCLGTVVLSLAASALETLIVRDVGARGFDVYTLVFLVLAPIYASVGAIILSRTAGNRVGWVLLVIGALLSIENFTGDAATYAATPVGRWVPAGVWMNWISNWIWVPGVVGALALLPLLFPTGRLPSKRWRPLAWVVSGCTSVSLGGYLFLPFSDNGGSNPVGLAIVTPMAGFFRALYVVALLVGVAAGAGSLLSRYRHGSFDERHQIKWFAGAFVLLAAMLAFYSASGVFGLALPTWSIAAIICIGLSAVPLTVAVAVLRYRLYDIDVVINRAFVYGTLALFITAVYVSIAVGIGELIGSGGKPNLGLSIVATAIVAIGFQPLRERLQRVANRLVYGARATPYEVLSTFSRRVADSYANDEVLSRMAEVLAAGTTADRAEVWLRSDDLLRRVAASPPDSSPPRPVRLDPPTAHRMPLADHTAEVRYQGELLGALTITKHRGETLTPIEVKLMEDLAHQAGLVLKNVGLSADLQARLGDLRASRKRLVAAQDDERRKLERNLHDGVQQHLVALKVKLGLLELQISREPGRIGPAIVGLKASADEALDTLRDLARGIYPPLLAEKGLAAALQSQARKAALPVHVEADGVGRFPQDTESALYFCTLEALQNVQKYARASSATVRLEVTGGQVCAVIADDGRGFDTRSVKRGTGLTNMEDRLEAAGGKFQIDSTPGAGTTVRFSVPVTTPAEPARI